MGRKTAIDGERLRLKRELLTGLTIDQLAQRVRSNGHRCSASHLSRIECGRSQPGIPLMHALAREIGVPLTDILADPASEADRPAPAAPAA